jgi:hypothetical protein
MKLAEALLLSLLVPACGAPRAGTRAAAVRPASPSPARAAVQPPAQGAAALLEEYFARNPVQATLAGEHRFDDRWPDVSPAGLSAAVQFTGQGLRTLAALRTQSDAATAIDLDMMATTLALDRFTIEVERRWHTDPLTYASLIGEGLETLLVREHASVEERGRAVAGRLEGLPALVAQAVGNLSDPAVMKAPHGKVALGQIEGLVELVGKQLPERLAGVSPALRERLQRATAPALAAIERLASHVRGALPRAAGRWRLGPEQFAAKLGLTLDSDVPASALHARARDEHGQVRARMAELARELYEPLFGSQRARALPPRSGVAGAGPGGADAGGADRLTREVLAALAEDTVAPEALRDAAEANLARLRAFVAEHRLVDLDEREQLTVIWTPPHKRGVAVAGLEAPPALGAGKPGLPSFYLVQPVPADWPAERRRSLLREYNQFMLEILSIHEAIPGHFVQLAHAARHPSAIRKVFANGPFVEGWAVYSERLMVEAGYAGQAPAGARPRNMSPGLWRVKNDPGLRAKAIALQGQKLYLRAITNAILDHDVHAGSLDEEEAVRFMVQQSFQEEGEARGKWVRAQVTSTQLSTYFVGASAWFELRREAEERARARGGTLDLADFHRQALGHGAPPVHRLPELMGWRS